MNRQILLVEPNYKNKYPPMGLMKISTYYKRLGDHVTFFKGDLHELVLNDTYELLKQQLYANNDNIFWESYKPKICEYLRKGTRLALDDIPECRTNPIIGELLKYYREFYRKEKYFEPDFRKYDRVGITTLFTFYWDITITTINFTKKLCKKQEDVMIGGIMASILPEQVEAATGIKPFVGTLHTPGELDAGNNMVIDTLPLDYSILEEIDYKYPVNDAYFAYMTRGCVNHCSFCAVPKLEPEYVQFLPVSEQVRSTERKFGAKRNLLLLDNNVLASCRFNEIIDDIKKAGFTNEKNYTPPNLYEIAVQNLRDGYNDSGYIKSCVRQFRQLIKQLPADDAQQVYDLLKSRHLLEDYTASKESILDTYDILRPYFEQFYSKRPRRHYVDFNQGIDSRLINNENMKKLAEIPVKPLRIAFDHWNLHDTYERAVRIAVENGHNHLSNYMLYNFDDTPEELYKRLKLNIDLCEELNASIYSFPMKYHPISDPDFFSNRDYVGKHWNRKFIRTIQAILNSTKGKVGRGREFFNKAFGANEDEFRKLLYMPETMIVYRLYFEKSGITDAWWAAFNALTIEEMELAKPIIEANSFVDLDTSNMDEKTKHLISFYRITRDDAEMMMR